MKVLLNPQTVVANVSPRGNCCNGTVTAKR